MRLLLGCALASSCYAVAMRLLYCCYAVAIWLLCGCYAVAIGLLCGLIQWYLLVSIGIYWYPLGLIVIHCDP